MLVSEKHVLSAVVWICDAFSGLHPESCDWAVRCGFRAPAFCFRFFSYEKTERQQSFKKANKMLAVIYSEEEGW